MASGKYNVSQGSTAVLPSHPQRIQVHGLTIIKGIVVEVVEVVVVVAAITKNNKNTTSARTVHGYFGMRV